jgi:Arc/MetJ-type ribon-helix-helix transcriptional regulator
MQLMCDHDPMDETTPVTVHLPDHRVRQLQAAVDRGTVPSLDTWIAAAVEAKATHEGLVP